MNNIKVSKNFRLREFQCKDGSQLVKVDSKLVTRLQKLRDRIKKPIYITSGYRTASHNKKVGGSPTSQHLYGRAVDIKVTGMNPKTLAKHAESVGFDGIGIYKTFVHVDVRGYKARW